MAEIGRAAQAAVRSTTTSLVRVAPIRPQPYHNLALASILSRKSHMSTTSCMRSSNESTRATHISTSSPSRTQQQNYSSFNWGNPSRPPRTIENIADLDIRKPTSSSYDFAFRGQKDGQRDEEVDSDLAQDFASSIDITDLQSSKQSRHTAPVAPRAQIRLVPRTGRTVYVGSNVDIARSFKLLAVQVGQNKIRRDFQQQKFHERPGKKRKRLASERWRTRFRIGFKATISRVRELTAQGW
ncbi:hypothetical protein F5B22DRAFT_384520 [Xylaria bambusicola]|uniref:uncharacterized protein n=1 Tax=Xylaria bambusicola TaxID=326684 RepID=UPI002008E5A5|nr:uncharacterized protein F5B22DRAFT_384520 [Xylaria bambusicola]KAI0508789.1 hypothetical protein F5B22DRAFT_384520 [Xylaria bambusicola]